MVDPLCTSWHEVLPEEITPLIVRQYISTAALTIARFQLKAGAHLALHSHGNEQVTHVLEGALRFVFPDREIVLHSGEVLSIPPWLPHEIFVLEDTLVLDTFTPPRLDWAQGQDQYLRGMVAR